MRPTWLHTIDPVARYKKLYQALDAQSAWFSENAWLRFAAQAAVMQPAAPENTAHAIKAVSNQLAQRARWYEALSSPLNFVVAATLVQIGETAEAFDAEVESARALFHAAGFHSRGRSEIMAILALQVLSEGKPTTAPTIQRMRRIYEAMKQHHWWLTGNDDLPVCAILTTCRGTPEEIAGTANGIYQTLRDAGFKASNHLQAAANLLPLTGLPATMASVRFQALASEFQTHALSIWREDYDALALLSLLDHGPDRIVERFQSVYDQLNELQPAILGEVNFNIAADLTFLDLARFDRALRPLTDPPEVERMHALIRLQRAASTTLVTIPPTPIVMDQVGWSAVPGQF